MRALLEAGQAHALRGEAERPRGDVVEGGERALLRARDEDLLEATGLLGLRAGRVREQALTLDGLRDGLGVAGGDARLLGLLGDLLGRDGLRRGRGVDLAPGARRRSRLRVVALLVGVRLDRLRRGLQLAQVALRDRVELGDAAEAPVRVLVAVHVLQDHVAADLLRDAQLLDDAVVDGHDRGAAAGEDVDALAGLVARDDPRSVGAALDALDRILL